MQNKIPPLCFNLHLYKKIRSFRKFNQSWFFRFPLINLISPNRSRHFIYRPIRCLDSDVIRIRGTWLANRGRKYPKCTKRGTKSRERGKKILRYIEIDFSFKFKYRFGKICYAYRFAAAFGGSFALGSAIMSLMDGKRYARAQGYAMNYQAMCT